MSGALNFFFFADWEAAPDAPIVVEEIPGAGGGANKGKIKTRGKNAEKDYTPFTQEHWDAREAYLRTLYPEEPKEIPVDNSVLEYEREANRLYEERKQQLESLNAERAAEILQLRHSADIKAMTRHGARITEINTKIADLMGKQAFTRFMQ